MVRGSVGSVLRFGRYYVRREWRSYHRSPSWRVYRWEPPAGTYGLGPYEEASFERLREARAWCLAQDEVLTVEVRDQISGILGTRTVRRGDRPWIGQGWFHPETGEAIKANWDSSD